MLPCTLVVDDDPEIRELLCEYLAGRGWSPEGVGTAQEARLRLCSANPPESVVVDHRLPDGDGIELVLLATSRGLVSVLMTAYPSVEATLAGMQAGAATVLAKPFRLKELATELGRGRERMLNRRIELNALKLLEDAAVVSGKELALALVERLEGLVVEAGGQLVEDARGIPLGSRHVQVAPRFLPWVKAVQQAILRESECP
jgi:DNA-binding response OmpR family regulator